MIESPLIDWSYYSSLHDKVSEIEFEKAEAWAEKEVKLSVGWLRWMALDPEEFYVGQLKDCICNVMDKMADMKRAAAGRGISSVSNAGYSESYVLQTDTQVRAELQGSIRAWLSGTGLMGAY